MKKALRYLILAFTALALLLAGLSLALPYLVDSRQVREQIIEQVRAQTGRDMAVDRLSLSLFPWLGLSLHEVSLGNLPGFSATPMLTLDTLDVHIRILPLLQRRVEVDRIDIEGLVLRLERDQHGRGNWEDAARKPRAITAPASPPDRQPDTTATPGTAELLTGLSLAGLRLNNARIDWLDRQSGRRLSLTDLNLTIGRYRPGQPFDIDGRLRYRGQAPVEAARLQVTASATLDLPSRRLLLERLRVDNDLTTSLSQRGHLPTVLQVERLVTDLDTQILQATGLRLEAGPLRLDSEQLVIEHLSGQPELRARLKLHPFAPRPWLAELGLSLPAMAGGEESTLRTLALDTRLRAGPDGLQADALRLQLDDSTVTGNLAVRRADRPLVTFDLDVDRLDLDRYLPPAGEKTARRPLPAATAGTSSRRAFIRVGGRASGRAPPARHDPLAVLRAFDADGRLRIERLTVAGLRLQEADIPLRGRQGRFVLDPLQARLYGGTLSARLSFDARQAAPQTRLSLALDQVDASPLLKDMLDDDRLEGRASVRGKLAMRGLDAEAMLRSLGGELQLAFRDGAIKGINIPQMEKRLRARLKGQPLPATDDGERTAFSSLTGTVRIVDGVLHNNDLHMAMPHARAIGKGTASLPDRTLDYRLWIKFTSETSGQKGTRYEDMDKAALPVHVSGPFDQPRIEPDFDGLARALANREIHKQQLRAKSRLDEEIDKKRKELEKKARDALDRLFNKK